MRILIKFLLMLVFFNTHSLKADILKPLSSILPAQVIKIQLEGLMENDTPYKDRGIEQTWEFAHPINQRFTGPLNRFKEMIKGDSYKMLLNHVSHEIEEVYSDKDKAVYQVVVLDANKDFYKFRWQVEKFLKSGPLENCWLTTMVSQPISMGSST